MKKRNLLAACCTLALVSINAKAQSHQHGHGEVVIAQDGNTWEIHMSLPSADVFGFEHEPESKKERTKFDTQLARLQKSANVLLMPQKCKLDSYDVEVPFSEHEHVHDEHQDDYNNDDYSDDEHDQHETHSDVEIIIGMTCEQAPTELVITVFSVTDSINELLAQWTTDKGQGSRELTPAVTRLVF